MQRKTATHPHGAQASWISSATKLLTTIHAERRAGSSGNNAVCIFSVGDVYVQFLAPFGSDALVCEAVSEYSVPWVARFLTPKKVQLLRKLGFDRPGYTQNYGQELEVTGDGDLRDAARLVYQVLKDVFDVKDIGLATGKAEIPTGPNKPKRVIET